MRVRPIFAWYDLWVGLFVDRQKRRLYLFPLPCLGLVIERGRRRAWGGTGSPWWLLRGWFDSAPWRRPAPAEDRCIMGGPVGPAVHCQRRATGLWCPKHQPDDGKAASGAHTND